MIITIEGIPGAGKTTLSTILQEKLNAIIIPEILDTHTDYTKLSETEEELFFFDNDIKKSELARNANSTNAIVVLDRNYVSTLAYNYAATVTGLKNTFRFTLDWYLQAKAEKLIQPNIYIYLDVDVVEGIMRKGRVPGNDKEWSSIEFITAMKHFYDYSFPVIDPLVLKHTISSHDNLDKILKRVKQLCIT